MTRATCTRCHASPGASQSACLACLLLHAHLAKDGALLLPCMPCISNKDKNKQELPLCRGVPVSRVCVCLLPGQRRGAGWSHTHIERHAHTSIRALSAHVQCSAAQHPRLHLSPLIACDLDCAAQCSLLHPITTHASLSLYLTFTLFSRTSSMMRHAAPQRHAPRYRDSTCRDSAISVA